MMSGLTWVLDFNALFDQGKNAPSTRVEAAIPPKPLSKPAVKDLIRHTQFLNANRDTFFVDTPEESYCIQTGLNPGLQEFLTSRLDRLKTLKRGKPQRIAMVVLDGRTGFILAMAGFDLDDPKANPCTAADYPAASIFKLVTATASIDALGYTPQTPLYFNGNKYTLYKRQLTDKRNRYTVQTTLAKAFAQSINPVFGKLGQTHLGRERLNTYAHAFGFNQTPDTEFNFPEARFNVTESGYHLAELGCGFNRQTTISPLFAATMVTAVLNQGSSLMPRIVNQVKLSNGNVIYKSTKAVYKTPMAPETAQAMVQIMKQTVVRGTAKKSFRGFSRDKVLSGLVIGGKTGSLSNAEHTVKYDWFTGFGKEKNGSRAVAVAVVVGHRKYIGTRASTHAKAILKTYFSSLTNKKAPLPGQQAGQQQG